VVKRPLPNRNADEPRPIQHEKKECVDQAQIPRETVFPRSLGPAAIFGIHLIHSNFSCTELIGSSIVASDKGFIVNPEISQEEFSNLSSLFGVKRKATTANYGDIFVGNDVIANSNAVFVGSYTTAKEIMHIDEGLRGE